MNKSLSKKISEDNVIKNEVIPLASCVPHPKNYKIHPEMQLDRLVASLRRFGQVRSIVVQIKSLGSYLIVAGHGIVEAMRREGYDTVRADIIPSSWNDEQIKGYLLADNETARLSEENEELLSQLLQEQADQGFPLESIGWSDEGLQELIEELGNEVLDDQTKPERPPANLHENDSGVEYENKYAVTVICESEEHQERVFAHLKELGYTCKVLVV